MSSAVKWERLEDRPRQLPEESAKRLAGTARGVGVGNSVCRGCSVLPLPTTASIPVSPPTVENGGLLQEATLIPAQTSPLPQAPCPSCGLSHESPHHHGTTGTCATVPTPSPRQTKKWVGGVTGAAGRAEAPPCRCTLAYAGSGHTAPGWKSGGLGCFSGHQPESPRCGKDPGLVLGRDPQGKGYRADHLLSSRLAPDCPLGGRAVALSQGSRPSSLGVPL